LYIKNGRVSTDYITEASVANDFQRLGISLDQANANINEYLKLQKEEERKQKLKQAKEDEWRKNRVVQKQNTKPSYPNKSIPPKVNYRTDSISSIKNKIKEFAVSKYPNNIKMQRYTYNKQVSSYNYLIRAKNKELKRFSQRKYPNDYAMQKYTYEKQLTAKRYMDDVPNRNAKLVAKRKYPYDYAMQKNIYDKLMY
jgi:hypothetical protein